MGQLSYRVSWNFRIERIGDWALGDWGTAGLGTKTRFPFWSSESQEGTGVRSAATWFLILASACVGAPYLLGVQPRTRRERRYVAIAIAFLAWVLLLMATV